MSATDIPWTNLREAVEVMQTLMTNALANGSEDATEFVDLSYTLTAERIEALAAAGVDVLDEQQLFTYVSGYVQAVIVGHAVLHSYGYVSPALALDSEQCTTYVSSAIANLMPLMQLLPLHLILADA